MTNVTRPRSALPASLTLSALLFLTGCTPAQKQEAITELNSALSNLIENRALTEQFVRDVKANGNPSNPAYQQAQESYQTARRTYDRFLDSLEMATESKRALSLPDASPSDVQNEAADFLADATAVLKPDVNTRRIRFQRAVIIPENLTAQFKSLPKKDRKEIIDRFDRQVRWRSWGDI